MGFVYDKGLGGKGEGCTVMGEGLRTKGYER